jgi:hypothetical protein
LVLKVRRVIKEIKVIVEILALVGVTALMVLMGKGVLLVLKVHEVQKDLRENEVMWDQMDPAEKREMLVKEVRSQLTDGTAPN